MAKIALTALQQFSAGGNEYLEGHTIPLAHVATWPEGSLERRLNNGFVRYVEAAEEAKVKKGEVKQAE